MAGFFIWRGTSDIGVKKQEHQFLRGYSQRMPLYLCLLYVWTLCRKYPEPLLSVCECGWYFFMAAKKSGFYYLHNIA